MRVVTRWTAQLAAYLKLRLVAEFNQRLRFGERERSQLRAEPTYQNQSFHLASLVLFLPAVGRFQVLELWRGSSVTRNTSYVF